jgi:hypothetical protein
MYGSSHPWRERFPSINWFNEKSNSCPMYLGYPLTTSKEHMKQAVEKVVDSMQRHLQWLSSRQLSLGGKALAWNSLVSSKLWHLARLVLIKSHVKRIKSMMRRFIWSERMPKVNWQIICGDKRYCINRLVERTVDSASKSQS